MKFHETVSTRIRYLFFCQTQVYYHHFWPIGPSPAGLVCRISDEAETAALGAALQGAAVAQGHTVGVFVAEFHRRRQSALVTGEGGTVNRVLQPDPGLAELYREALARHQTLGRTLFGPP